MFRALRHFVLAVAMTAEQMIGAALTVQLSQMAAILAPLAASNVVARERPRRKCSSNHLHPHVMSSARATGSSTGTYVELLRSVVPVPVIVAIMTTLEWKHRRSRMVAVHALLARSSVAVEHPLDSQGARSLDLIT